MALLRWTELSWDEFVTGLEGFRDNYSGKSREDEDLRRVPRIDAEQTFAGTCFGARARRHPQ